MTLAIDLQPRPRQTRRRLLIGIQTFRELIDSDCYSVDQTDFALRLIEQGKYYNDFAGLEQLFRAFVAGIPGDWFRKNSIAQYEGYYASVFYAYSASLGLDLTPEDSSNAGRLGLALRFNGQIYLFEFKVVELSSGGRALQQIKDRGYANKYRAEGLPIHLIGVEFSHEQLTLVGFEVESLP